MCLPLCGLGCMGAWAQRYTVTVYKAAAGGMNYDEGTTYTIIAGVGFRLDSFESLPAHMRFRGWLQDPVSAPTTWEAVDGEKLEEPGVVILPTADVRLYARYDYIYGQEWTWASDYLSASVRVTNLEYNTFVANVGTNRISSSVSMEPTDDTPGMITYTATATMMRPSDEKVFTFTDSQTMPLVNLNEDDNTAMLAASNGKKATVALTGRTLYKDGTWNTICLPFNLTLEGSPLAGATVKELVSADFHSSSGTLTLDFEEVASIKAGIPYIIKWDGDTELGPDDLVFKGVTIINDNSDKECAIDDGIYVTFCGTYKKLEYGEDDRDILFLGANNTLYYPLSGGCIGAQRAYFKLSGLRAGDLITSLAKANTFVLDFDDGESSGIDNVQYSMPSVQSEAWYTLDGRKLSGKPTVKGIYINNGRKVIIR